MSDYLSQTYNLHGKTILVTGACGQLGQAICQSYLDIGAVVIATDKNISGEKIDSEHIEYVEMDITAKNNVGDVFGQLYTHKRKVDVLINNAGISVFEPFEIRPEESFDAVMDVNLKGTFFCIQTLAQHARANKHKGNIVNIASFYGVISPDPRIYTDCDRHNSEVYGATKAGVIQMTKYFAVHLASDDIRVNCISPGGIYNPESPQGGDFINNYSSRCPMNRMAKVEEMVGGVLYLSSDASSYTNGHNLVIDGAMSCW